MSQPIPTPESLDAAFLADCLRAAGYGEVRLRGFTAQPIGTGQLGRCIRYALDYEGDPGAAPRSLVGKFPSVDPMSRATAMHLRSYRKEVCFYRELAPRLKIRTPRCYHAAIEGDGPEFVLLLEDLAPAQQGDQLAGCSPAVARAAVLELAGLHGPTWCDPALRGLEWLGAPDATTVTIGRALYRAQLAPFLGRFRAGLAPDEARIIEQVAESEGPPFEPLPEVFAAVHVDYRLDNLLVREDGTVPRVTAVDWQSVTLGSPLSDVAYFLGAGLVPEARRACEREIVEDYRQALASSGASALAGPDCWQAYRRGAFAGFAVTVIASVMVEKTGRGDAMFTAMARRHARHALDVGAEEFLAS